MLYLFGKIFIAPIVFLLMRPRIKGLKNLYFRGKAIIVSNHWSLGDPIFLAVVSPRVIHFMAKQELFVSRAARILFKSLFTFPVNRKQADITSMKHAKDVLDKGKVFGIFPEGRRSLTGELDTLEKGAAFLALRCNAPIIPVYSDPKTLKKFQIHMIVGEPIDAKAVAAEHKGKSVDVVTEAIGDRLRQLKYAMEAQ